MPNTFISFISLVNPFTLFDWIVLQDNNMYYVLYFTFERESVGGYPDFEGWLLFLTYILCIILRLIKQNEDYRRAFRVT